MARLRQPGTAPPNILTAPPPAVRTPAEQAPRRSPRKTSCNVFVPREKVKGDVGCSGEEEESTPARRMRVLGSRRGEAILPLFEKKSRDASVGGPEGRVRRERLGRDVGGGRVVYCRTLARSVARGKGVKEVEEVQEVIEEEDVEKSVLCGDAGAEDNGEEQDTEACGDEAEDEEEELVVNVKSRGHVGQRWQAILDSEVDEDGGNDFAPLDEPNTAPYQALLKEKELSPPLISCRPPFQKDHSTVSTWAQDVIDLTSSPEAPASFVLTPPTRPRTISFPALSRPTTAESKGYQDADAILRFSPTPNKHRSPRKAPPIPRPSTPPLALASPTKLVSPSKKNRHIPRVPGLRVSTDAFWNPEEVNNWNDLHSPAKPLLSPRKQNLFLQLERQMKAVTLEDDSSASAASVPSPTTSPQKKRPQSPIKSLSTDSTSVAKIRAQRKEFAARKHDIAAAFLNELDTKITSGRISALCQSTGGIKLLWSRTLKTTAGRANWRREQIRLRAGPLPTDLRTEFRHHCSIELAEKVIDDEERLYNVLAHEFCHLTTFMISEVRNNPHGTEFKSWGAKVTAAFAHKHVHVTTKHSYKIDYKYVWECISCGFEFMRHSKSVDTARHSCGKCRGALVQTKPMPRGTKKLTPGKEKSEYQIWVKEHFGRVKADMVERGEVDVGLGRVMEVVARQYKEFKGAKGRREGEEFGEVEKALEGLAL